MAALLSLLIVLSLSLLINRIATEALALTGLSREAAQFQASSAFTGAGFTTNEAENIVNHPLRRRIVMLLMLLGNAGIVTSISSLMLTFVNTASRREWMFRLLLLGIGLAVMWFVATSHAIALYLSQIIQWGLQRWSRLEVRDYASLLHLSGEYTVTQLKVQPDDWLANQRLDELELDREGVTVLGINRGNGRYVGAPKGETRIRPNDTLILYGRLSTLGELDQRSADWAGEREHRKAVVNQQRLLRQQDWEEAEDDNRD